METQIKKNRSYRYFNIVDIIYKTISAYWIRNVYPIVNTKTKKRIKKEKTMHVPENLAANYQLGWRKDA